MSRLGFSIRGCLGIDHNNSRAAARREHSDDAWIRAEGSLLRRCQVLDLSRTGARLAITNTDRIPETFALILSKGSAGRPTRVKWRRHTQIGVEFQLGR